MDDNFLFDDVSERESEQQLKDGGCHNIMNVAAVTSHCWYCVARIMLLKVWVIPLVSNCLDDCLNREEIKKKCVKRQKVG